MKVNKKGALHFETEQEIRNFMRLEFNPEKVKQRAKNRERIISYEDPHTKYQVCLQGIRRLDKTKHRDGMRLLETIVKAAMERQRLVTIADETKEPTAKYYIIQQAKKLDKSEVYKLFVNEWRIPLEKVIQLEKDTIEAIGKKCDALITPITMGHALIDEK